MKLSETLKSSVHHINKGTHKLVTLKAIVILSFVGFLYQLQNYVYKTKIIQLVPACNISKRKTIIETKYPITLSQDFRIENKNICRTDKRLSCVIMIHSDPSNFERREVMRKTFLDLSAYRPETIRIVFLFGTPTESTLQQKLEKENQRQKDIVQGHFKDSYHNLTYKGVMGLKWINDNCRNAEFVVKIDDDVFVHVLKVFSELPFLRYQRNTFACRKISPNVNPIQRGGHDGWRVDNDEFKQIANYPFTSCSGAAVFMTSDLVPKLLRSALFSPFFWIDDVYLFGILPSKLKGIKYHSINNYFTLSVKDTTKCFLEKGKLCNLIIGTVSREDSNTSMAIWNSVKKVEHK